MNDFHGFISRLLAVWLVAYTLIFGVALVKPVAMFVLACFDFAPTAYWDLMNVLHAAALWMVPTLFLIVAYALSRPNRRLFQ
jgi:hypothetical protein